jgi:hypothetical protein
VDVRADQDLEGPSPSGVANLGEELANLRHYVGVDLCRNVYMFMMFPQFTSPPAERLDATASFTSGSQDEPGVATLLGLVQHSADPCMHLAKLF